MAFFAFDHVHLRSANPLKTAQWYHRMFGARILETPQAGGTNRVDLDFGNLMVFIQGPLPAGEEAQGLKAPHYGLDHFGVRVENLERAIAELKSKGAEFVSELRTLPNGVKISFVRGPEDVRIEVLERPWGASAFLPS